MAGIGNSSDPLPRLPIILDGRSNVGPRRFRRHLCEASRNEDDPLHRYGGCSDGEFVHVTLACRSWSWLFVTACPNDLDRAQAGVTPDETGGACNYEADGH
jgi:hypothetical protein